MKFGNKWTDEEVIAKICGAEEEREAALEYWYNQRALHDWVAKYVASFQGSKGDAHDTYIETFIVFERLIRNNRYNRNASLSTFFISIAKWQWYMIRRKRNKTEPIDPESFDQFLVNEEDLLFHTEQKEVLEELLEKLGERCKKTLTLYKLGYSMREIAAQIPFSSEAMAIKEAFNCRKKLKTLIESHRDWADLLKITK